MDSRIEPQLLRRLSVRRVLDAIRDRGPSSRAELARRSGISPPTVSKVVAALLDAQLLEEGDSPSGALGRPGRLIRLATESAQVVGLELEPRSSVLRVARLDGVETGEPVEIGMPEDYDDLIVRIVEAVVEAGRRTPGGAVVGVGISTPGLIDREAQRVLLSPNLPVTNERSVGRDLADRLDVPCVMVQESHALCLAERMSGGARGLDYFAVMDISTGLGLGVMENGELIHGHRGLAGELGHWTVDPGGRRCGCGNRGCLETVATDRAFVTRLSERLGLELPMAEVIERVRSGELNVDPELEPTVASLAIGLAAVINLFNPQALFVYGRLPDLGSSVLDSIRSLTFERALGPSMQGCRLERARGGKAQGAIAAILDHVLSAQ